MASKESIRKDLTISSQEGDVLLTGTPDGVGAVIPGDAVECQLRGPDGKELLSLNFAAVQREGGYNFQE